MSAPPEPKKRIPPWLGICLLGLLLTLLNAFKPLHIDDSTFYQNAEHIAKHPTDPYGFAMMKFDEPVPANEALAPPVLPYWWAAAIWLFGNNPFLWKLWLLPFCLILVFALAVLYRRFAGGLEGPLLWMTVLSPILLPSLNLMMDIPALGLSLAAIAVFCRAVDRQSLVLAAAAGLIAGLAMETKYTSLLVPAVLFVYAFLFRKLPLWCLATALAGAIFVAWEGFMAYRYGDSHFYYHFKTHPSMRKEDLILPFLQIVGCVAPVLGLLGVIALRLGRWAIVAASLLIVLEFGLVTYAPEAMSEVVAAGQTRKPVLGIDVVYGTMGTLVCGALVAVCFRVLRAALDKRQTAGRAVNWFLALWLAMEVAGYFALSPFPAVRRIMGFVVVGTLLAGHLAVAAGAWRVVASRVRYAAAISAVLGLGFFAVDYWEARTGQVAAQKAADHIRKIDPEATIWYTGYWGFQFYAEQAGMHQIVPTYMPRLASFTFPEASVFQRGDYLVVPDPNFLPEQKFILEKQNVEMIETIPIKDELPVRTGGSFYGGNRPLSPLRGNRFAVYILRVKNKCTPVVPGRRSAVGFWQSAIGDRHQSYVMIDIILRWLRVTTGC